MKKLLKEIILSFLERPLWTLWSLFLCPFYYLFVLMAATMIGLINLSFNDFKRFIEENT